MNKKAVSAIIGVILMVAITVTIAVVTWIYVDNLIDTQEQEPSGDTYIEGWVIDAYDIEKDLSIDDETSDIWKITLGVNYDTEMENTTSYYCVFTHGNAPPPETVHLRLFYDVINNDFGTVFDIYKVKSL